MDPDEGGDVSASPEHRNEISGDVFGPAVQVHTVHGGVHLHQSSPAVAVPSQLPPSVDLSGRSRDLAALDKARAGGIVVISGPPGIGKTALAVRWGHVQREGFPDGQLFADLRGHAIDGPTGPAEILGRFLRALGTPSAAVPTDLAELTALYRSVTNGRRVLVVLDDALTAAQASPLLPASTGSVALVTSRWRLSGLVARGARTIQLDRLEPGAALELLTRVLGEERVTAEPAAAQELARLCAHFPLTLCVAGARLAVRPRWPISEMADALQQEQHRLSVLSVNEDTAIRAALDLSYRAIPAEVARLYRLIGLFPGVSFDSRIAAAAAELSGETARDLLEDLTNANLLDDAVSGRYKFHDLIRLHARELAEQEESSQSRAHAIRRMLDWYLAAVTQAGQLVTPYRHGQRHDIEYPPAEPIQFADSADALDWLEQELPNLHAVVSYARNHSAPDVAWQTVDAMWPLFLRRGHYRERLEFDRIALAAAQESGDTTGQAKMLDRLGLALTTLGRLNEARMCLEQALVIWRSGGNYYRQAGSLQRLGLTEHARGHPEEAIALFTQALDTYQRLGEKRAAALTLADIGAALTDADRADEAVGQLQRARELLADVPDSYNQARTLARLGWAQARAGKRVIAADTLEEALHGMRQAQSPRGEAEVLRLLGDLAEAEGQVAQACRHYDAALVILDPLGAPGVAALRDHLMRLNPPE
jgi:tetratricopeptide (TPR) repeat protein